MLSLKPPGPSQTKAIELPDDRKTHIFQKQIKQ